MKTLNLTEEQYDRILWALCIAGNTSFDRDDRKQGWNFYNLADELRETYGEPIED